MPMKNLPLSLFALLGLAFALLLAGCAVPSDKICLRTLSNGTTMQIDCQNGSVIGPAPSGVTAPPLPPAPPKPNATPSPPPNSAPSERPPAPTMTQELCQGARGSWNECASACRGRPDDQPCIKMCVPQCECGGIAGFGCPAGFECTDYLPKGAADAMGVCAPVQR